MTDIETKETTINRFIFAFAVVLGIGVITVLIFLIYITLLPKEDRQSSALEQNQTKWESLHITNYRMPLDPPFFDYSDERMPITVEAMNNKVISAVDAQGQGPPVNDPGIYSVPWLFSYAHQRIWQGIDSIDIT